MAGRRFAWTLALLVTCSCSSGSEPLNNGLDGVQDVPLVWSDALRNQDIAVTETATDTTPVEVPSEVECVPNCLHRQCGDDGCGGSCGECAPGTGCSQGTCLGGGDCGDVLEFGCCDGDTLYWCEDDLLQTLDCPAAGETCGWDGANSAYNCGGEGPDPDAKYPFDCGFCQPDCAGKACGDNGCEGSCGECPGPQDGCAAGICVCQPDCGGKECGDDGCGGACGPCAEGFECEGETCVCDPNCDGKVCGDDGCGGSCGECQDSVCDGSQCCEPQCEGKLCGDNGCNGSCGDCLGAQDICAEGICVCQADCTNKDCGPDGCQGSCGQCLGLQEQCNVGKCVCQPDCAGKTCGSDGCDGLCFGIICPDADNDGIPDDLDAFPNDPNEWADSDGDGTGNNADLDDDNDGLLDVEETEFGDDCSLTDPENADSDFDGISDKADAYPNDAFPAFMLMPRNDGHMWVKMSDGEGGFGNPITIGEDLGWVCATEETCSPGCPAGQHCEMATCVADAPAGECPNGCGAGFVCRQQQYRYFAIADFDGDGAMDFIAHSYPMKESGTHSLWFFYRLEQGTNFPQNYVGEVDEPITGVLTDADGDFRFDFVKYYFDKPNNPTQAYGYTFLGGGPMVNAPCVIGSAPDQGCSFTRVNNALDILPQANGKWGIQWAKTAQDLSGDGNVDLTFGVYTSGGASDTKVYLMLGNGDGTFNPANEMFTHAGQKGPANSFLFADFTTDELGDVVLGLDDDGDAGSAWMYEGTGPGSFSSAGTKIFDLNPSCNGGCGDKMGMTGSARTFDFNFDGNLDIVVGHSYCDNNENCYMWTAPDSKLQIYMGNGDGTFGDAQLIHKELGNSLAGSFAIPTRICPWYVY